MKLEEQVCSIDIAKRLKELGVSQESVFYWRKTLSLKKPFEIFYRQSLTPSLDEDYSAFTVAELGEILPPHSMITHKMAMGWCGTINGKDFTASTEADARAKMLIHLIEKGIVKP